MALPTLATSSVLLPSQDLPSDAVPVEGYKWDGPLDYNKLLQSYATSGFQASNFGSAVDVINKMTLCFLTKNRMVDVVVSTAGGVEEDIIKCLSKTYMGSFSLPGKDLREQGINRIGNLLVPNNNYCAFEDFFMPFLHSLLDEQEQTGIVWTPSKIIHKLGETINDETSVCYWCYKNNIPIYCPALTDGSMGDMIYFFSYKRPGLIIDLVGDIRALNDTAVTARHSGMIVLGGGLVKHHIFNANLMRNGADYAVVVNTASEFDGSDAGAKPDEAVSWGKIRLKAASAKVHADATLVFPLLVAQTFARITTDETHIRVKEQLCNQS
ncbi:hypothetical protein GEMRC1_003644 [Eukaryota sp. GEM-RC1]